jgi:dolichol-phosphate mannosyltransferase
MPDRVIVVLPAFNEEANIGRLLDRLREAMTEASLSYRVIVVNDGSRDRTAEILAEYQRRLPLTVVHHAVNLGLGAAMRDGLQEAAGAAGESDVIVTMDSDESHTPAMILRMLALLGEGRDVVIASRYQPGARVHGLSLSRRFLSGRHPEPGAPPPAREGSRRCWRSTGRAERVAARSCARRSPSPSLPGFRFGS